MLLYKKRQNMKKKELSTTSIAIIIFLSIIGIFFLFVAYKNNVTIADVKEQIRVWSLKSIPKSSKEDILIILNAASSSKTINCKSLEQFLHNGALKCTEDKYGDVKITSQEYGDLMNYNISKRGSDNIININISYTFAAKKYDGRTNFKIQDEIKSLIKPIFANDKNIYFDGGFRDSWITIKNINIKNLEKSELEGI